MDKLTTKSLRSSFSNNHPSIRHTDYCSKCGAHFSVEEDVYTCWTDGCDELWYAGPRNMQHQKVKMLFCHSASRSAALKSASERQHVAEDRHQQHISHYEHRWSASLQLFCEFVAYFLYH